MSSRTARRAVEIRLFGPPDVRVAGAPLQVDTRKAIAILAVLATDRRAYARDELAALLWPDSDDAGARGALRRTLSVMRSSIDEAVLRIDRQRVELDEARAWVDVAELERRSASGSVEDLSAAADLVRGPFLAGFSLRDSPEFDDWRAVRASALERTVVGVLDRLVAALAAAGDLGRAAEIAGRRIDLDPIDEAAHVSRMELLAASGDRAGAIRQYRTCVATLERELGVPPLPETTARYQAIRDAPEEPAASRPPIARNPALRDPGPATDALPERIPLVGRDEALTRIEAARLGADRDGAVVAITGEPGIGKSRLVEAAAASARARGARVLVTRAFAVERRIAYAPLVDAFDAALDDDAMGAAIRALDPATLATLASIVPRLGVRSPSDAAEAPLVQARLLATIAGGLAAALDGTTPGLLVVDDLHWVDDASLGALAYLVRRLGGRRFAVVLTWRTEELDDAAAPIANLITSRPGAVAINLERLDREQVLGLVAAVDPAAAGAAADGLWEASEGLPLYLAEALAGGTPPGAGLPPGVRAVLAERLGGVEGLAGQILTAAAAIGRSFDLTTLREASGRTEDEVVEATDALTRRGLIRPADGRSGGDLEYDFAHGALRELVEAGSSLARRRLLHRRIADALRGGGAGARDDPARLGRIAWHEREAGRDAEAAEAYRQAGDAARRVFANRDAIELYEAALGLDHPATVELHVAIGELSTRVGEYDRAIASFEAAAALAEPGSVPDIEAALARAHMRRGDLTAADRHLEAALDTGREGPWRAARLLERAAIRRRAEDRDGALAASAEAATVAGQAGDASIAGAARRLAGLLALDVGDATGAMDHLVVALDAASDDPDPSAAIAALTGLALATAAAGDVDGAVARGEDAIAACRRIGDRHLEAAVENHLADILHEAGRDEEALVHLRRAVEAFAEVGGNPADPDPGIWMLAAS